MMSGDRCKALVEKLRKARVWPDYSQSRVTIETAHEAADIIETQAREIERLRAENARLKEAVVDLADNIDDWDGVSGITEAVIDTARAALGEPQ